ncbi:adenylate/guanylate cyclase domain-containing protein [Mycobacterium sp. CBMA 234]|uniref:adenylate/guanylate cyclase domain-containing protein n=1 Tax=Mycolicibacterium sp. CBMA 234 TaxID=1918495 RepID=UPI001391E95C|nr:adenylate/guanylate cyclase domain-containing protein [Mycolicibacterium sp. CBMA 234]MUL64578.1 adenylate/guanylate cyclase domain-containing protein [Mycolicibacterium sp. CBMA 234]
MFSDADGVAQGGLPDGLAGRAREERRELIEWLLRRGFRIDQIRNSLSPMMLAANRTIGDDGTVRSAREVAESSGLPADLIQRLHFAVGLARADDPRETLYSRSDAESIVPAASLVEFGFGDDEIALLVRLLVDGLTRFAVTMRQAALQTLIRPGATELELAEALERLAVQVEPLLDPMINRLARLTLRHSFETEAVNAAERAMGQLPGARPVTVAFADVVGFTRMGEAVPPEDLVEVASRLADLTRRVVVEPVRFIKTIGDAVMLVSTDAEKLTRAVLDMVRASAADQLPPLRAGVASGLAVSRAGDWYGSPVNLASRVTGVTPAGAVLITGETRDAIGEASGIAWSFEKAAHLKGIRGEVRLFRATKVSPA